ncbi:MAG: hypothetical protein HRT87_11300 [Legionellales bacterium]|nr:hypothetical protein [Legionellales bacterium]
MDHFVNYREPTFVKTYGRQYIDYEFTGAIALHGRYKDVGVGNISSEVLVTYEKDIDNRCIRLSIYIDGVRRRGARYNINRPILEIAQLFAMSYYTELYL